MFRLSLEHDKYLLVVRFFGEFSVEYTIFCIGKREENNVFLVYH